MKSHTTLAATEVEGGLAEVHRVNPEDPRVRRTRQLLQEAFQSLLAEKGFEELTVQDMAERATVNRATFYAHYRDKYDIAESFVRETFRKHLVAGLPPAAPVSPKSLEMLVAAVLRYLEQVYGHCRLDRQFGSLIEDATHRTLQEYVADWLRNGARSRSFAKGPQLTAAAIVSSSVLRAGIEWCRGDRKRPVADLARDVVTVLAPGVTGAAGAR